MRSILVSMVVMMILPKTKSKSLHKDVCYYCGHKMKDHIPYRVETKNSVYIEYKCTKKKCDCDTGKNTRYYTDNYPILVK